MRYAAVITKDGKDLLATFAGLGGIATGGPPERIEEFARDALVGWLESHLAGGQVPPRPPKTVKGKRVIWVEVPARLVKRIERAWGRAEC